MVLVLLFIVTEGAVTVPVPVIVVPDIAPALEIDAYVVPLDTAEKDVPVTRPVPVNVVPAIVVPEIAPELEILPLPSVFVIESPLIIPVPVIDVPLTVVPELHADKANKTKTDKYLPNFNMRLR